MAVNEKGVRVDFPRVNKSYFMNPLALKRLAPYSIGQAVRVKVDFEIIQSMIAFNLPDDKIGKVS